MLHPYFINVFNPCYQSVTTSSETHIKYKRITQEVKDFLHACFTQHHFSQNTKLPRLKSPGNSGIDEIINGHSLHRSQASQKLTNWKANHFEIDETMINNSTNYLIETTKNHPHVTDEEII